MAFYQEVIALNQDKGFVQGRKMLKENNVEVWMKPLESATGKIKAIAILNRGEETVLKLTAGKIGVTEKSRVRDLWLHKDLGKMGREQSFTIPKHGIVLLKVD